MKRILYLGTDPSRFLYKTSIELVHYPVLRLVPRKLPHEYVEQATHLLFTSKNCVRFFFDERAPLSDQKILAIGKVTAEALAKRNFPPWIVAEEETQEGLIARLEMEDMKGWSIFYPRSSKARPHLANFFFKKEVFCIAWDFYDLVFQKLEPVPVLDDFDAVVFTSPSTVEGFFLIFPILTIPSIAIGPITEQALNLYNIRNQRYD